MREIAVLVSSYNRVDKTLNLFETLNGQHVEDLHMQVFLLDDASQDGTVEKIRGFYSKTIIEIGTGNLFWAGSMRKIWKRASKEKDFDFFLLLNDDVELHPDALSRLICVYDELNSTDHIIIGSTISKITNKISYGGTRLNNQKYNKGSLIEPDPNKPLTCHFGNANIMLIDKVAFKRNGIFSEAYTHGIADYDYTFSATKNGTKVWVAPGFYGYCEDDHGKNWLSPASSLPKRIEYLISPKGLAYNEYLYYMKKHFRRQYFSSIIKLWAKTLFPVVWEKFKKRV